MKKVVLLAINAKYVHSSLSVWVIAEGISQFAQFSYDVSVLEATINQSTSEIVESVTSHNPDIIGISSYIWNAAMLPVLLSRLRVNLPEVIIVLGGPEASNNASYWLDKGANHVLQGEGEYVFPQFLDSLSSSCQKNRSLDILSCQKNHSGSNNGSLARQWNRPLDRFPVNPYTAEFLETLGSKLAYIETSRGCPFQCAFCLSADSNVKYFPIDFVKKQIQILSKSTAMTIKFVDRTFNCNAERAYEIFEFILGLETHCCFHFEVAADLFTENQLSLLEAAPVGRIQFEIGLQSFYAPALEASSRQTDIIKAEQNVKKLMEMGNIHVHVDLIAGLPYETLDDFKKSFNRAYLLNAHHLQLGFLKLLHGSKLREDAESLGIKYNKEPPYEIISSPWLSVKDLLILKQTENALQSTRNKNRFLSTLDYVLQNTRIAPFDLMHLLGSNIPNRGKQLEEYIVELYNFFSELPDIDTATLKDCMIYDWLGMVKGKNSPAFLKNDDPQRKCVAEKAEKILNHKLKREEYAVLSTGKGIFVNRNNRNPVTGLYEVLKYE